MLGGQEIIDDMASGAEAYLQMWERATGIAQPAGGSATLGASAGTSRQGAKKCAALRAKLKRAKSQEGEAQAPPQAPQARLLSQARPLAPAM